MDLLVDRRIFKFKDNEIKEVDDLLAIERPLEIFLDKMPYIMTMRLPNDDVNLVRGILFSNGVIEDIGEIKDIYYCKELNDRIYVELNRVKRDRKDTPLYMNRFRWGERGKEDIDIPKLKCKESIDYRYLFKIKDNFEARMELFFKTGCVHAVAIFSHDLDLLAFGEDVGRYNAFDKCIGHILAEDKRSHSYLAICSSRLSFEVVHKAARLGIQILAGFSAPTSMCVEFAHKWGITVIGFLRKKRFNIYTYAERVKI